MLALPSRAFGDVQRFLKQKRATGRRVSPTEEKSAWSAYWDAMYGMRAEGTRLGLEKERIETGKEQFAEQMAATKEKFGVTTDLTREQIKAGERSAMIGGVAQLAGTTALGAYALKGTAIGAKIGLGAVKEGAVPATGEVGAITGETLAPTTFAPYLTGATLAFGGGALAKEVPVGSGAKTEQLKGAAVGAGIGGYLAAGTAMGGPVGAVLGGVLGLTGAVVAGGK